jgi:hypothetical protein
MANQGLRDLCFLLLSASADRFLERQWSDGRFATEAERNTDEWNFYDQQYLLPAALLYTSDRPDSPWRGSARLWEAILSNGRHLASRVAADGTMEWRLNGVVLGSPFVCQRLTCAWLQAYQLLRDRLPEEEAERWRSGMLRASTWLYEHKVRPFRAVTRFTSHQVQTGTNHFSLYLSLLWLAGREFHRPEWVAVSADLMRRLIADQRPGGYWEEHHGPALGYNYLTYHGVEEYTAWSRDETGQEALRRGLDLHQHWTYPDGLPIECIDGRMRHLSGPMLWGLSGFARWPEGRGYARLLLEQLAKSEAPLSGETLARVAVAYLLLCEGDEEAPPQAREHYRNTLDDVSIVRKDGPWIVALSGQCSPPWPENQFCLDRQALVSVWREGSRLVVDGSNAKFQPELATFHRPDGECLPRSARLRPRAADEEGVESRYDTFTAGVRARILGAEAMELRVGVSDSRAGGPIIATVVPHVCYGETLTIGAVGSVTLGEAPLHLAPREHGGWLAFRGVKLHLPEGASIAYPISPFNSYSADNRSGPGANRLVVRWGARHAETVLRVGRDS